MASDHTTVRKPSARNDRESAGLDGACDRLREKARTRAAPRTSIGHGASQVKRVGSKQTDFGEVGVQGWEDLTDNY